MHLQFSLSLKTLRKLKSVVWINGAVCQFHQLLSSELFNVRYHIVLFMYGGCCLGASARQCERATGRVSALMNEYFSNGFRSVI